MDREAKTATRPGENIDGNQRYRAMFLAHGSPMNAIQENDFTRALRKLGQSLPRPEAILVISAHWLTAGTFVTGHPRPATVHDFYGFPRALYRLQYPAPGAPELAKLIAQSLAQYTIGVDDERGLDHGAWGVLIHLFPEADVPVVQMSIDIGKPTTFHYTLGQELKMLRERGVLVVGSGNIVHNLQKIVWEEDVTAPFDWAVEFDSRIWRAVQKRDISTLLNYEQLGVAAPLAVPSPDHYLPLLYILGMADENEQIQLIYEGFQHASISMRSFLISGEAKNR